MNEQQYRKAVNQIQADEALRERIEDGMVRASEKDQQQRKPKQRWKAATAGVSAAALLLVCAVGVRFLLPKPQEDQTEPAASLAEIAQIPQYEYNGMLYEPAQQSMASMSDAGELLTEYEDGSALYRCKSAPSQATAVHKQGETYTLCQFVRLTEGHASGEQILSIFEGNGGITSLRVGSGLETELTRPEQIQQFTDAFSKLTFSDEPLFDHSVPDRISDGAVCHVVTLQPACTVTYANGISFTLSYERSNGLLEGLGSSFQPSEEIASLLELSSMAVVPPSSPNS